MVDGLAELVRARRPGLDVRVGYLDHGPPHLAEVAAGVVVPLLLASGYHVRVDIPAQAPGCLLAGAVGPDARLATVLAARLREAGWGPERPAQPVVLAAAGSTDPLALADVDVAAAQLAAVLGVPVGVGFAAAGTPRLADLDAAAVATYLLAPGRFADVVSGCGAPIVAAPLGPAPEIAAVVLDRYDTALAGRPR